MVAIKTIKMQRMGKSLHAGFHKALLDNIARLGGAEAIGLDPTTVEAYATTVVAEATHMPRQGKSGITRQMAEQDAQRNGLLEGVLDRLRHLDLWPDAKVRAAVEPVQRLITDGYTLAIKRKTMQGKSALITALLVDLEKIDAEVLATLGVDVLARELRRVNEAHGQAYLARHKERAEQGTGVVMRLRRETDGLYHLLCIDALYWANRTDVGLAAMTADPTERERLTARRATARRFVGNLNRHITHYKHYYFNRDNGEAPEDEAPEAPADADTADTTQGAAPAAEAAHHAAPEGGAEA